MDSQSNHIPVTLLTGFLGAGKTTLLNHLIRDPEAGRIAVIMNEFGKVGLDHDLIEESTEETILMQSGCLCCTFRGDISKTLNSLMERRNAGELAFDRVVIETTGIADPAPILHTLVVDDLIAANYRMDGVVTAADAATGSNTLDMHEEAVNQIAIAEVIVVTKADLVSLEDLAAYEQRLAGLNSSASIIHAKNGEIPTGALFDLTPLKNGANASDIARWLGKATFQGTHNSNHDAIETTPLARHDRQINSSSFEVEAPISSGLFDLWLDTLIAYKGPDILRIKGIVHVEGAECPFVFHGVQHIFDPPVPLRNWNKDDKTSRITVIARDMTNEDLKASLRLLNMRPNGSTYSPTDNSTIQKMAVPF